VWGRPDVAFAGGLAGLAAGSTAARSTADREAFVGVHPVDTRVGRRPVPTHTVARAPAGRSDRGTRSTLRGRRRTAGVGVIRHGRGPAEGLVGAALFPDGEPALPEAMPVGGERMDVRYVVGVLMGNRDLMRRLAAENVTDVPAGTT
jgi:hypothetical protein